MEGWMNMILPSGMNDTEIADMCCGVLRSRATAHEIGIARLAAGLTSEHEDWTEHRLACLFLPPDNEELPAPTEIQVSNGEIHLSDMVLSGISFDIVVPLP